MVKLKEHDVISIRAQEGSGRYGTDELATQYGVSRRHIQRIVSWDAWTRPRTPAGSQRTTR